MPERAFTIDQSLFMSECHEHYGIDPNQITFHDETLTPRFDKEALNKLRLLLTDIISMEESEPVIKETTTLVLVSVKATGMLPDGRTAGQVGTAFVNEPLKDGTTINDVVDAQNVAAARAERRVLRAFGIDLVKAHREHLASGAIAAGDDEFADPIGKQIKALANETGFIVNGDDRRYRDFIQGAFGHKDDGLPKRSMLDLNDIEKSQLVKLFESMRGHHQEKKAA